MTGRYLEKGGARGSHGRAVRIAAMRMAAFAVTTVAVWSLTACAPRADWAKDRNANDLLETAPPTVELLEVALEPAPPFAAPVIVVERRPPELLEGLVLERPSQVPAEERAALARLRRVQITLEVYVDERGHVRQVSVRDTNEPGRAYQEAALASVGESRFLPGTQNGVPTSMWTLLSVEYPLP